MRDSSVSRSEVHSDLNDHIKLSTNSLHHTEFTLVCLGHLVGIRSCSVQYSHSGHWYPGGKLCVPKIIQNNRPCELWPEHHTLPCPYWEMSLKGIASRTTHYVMASVHLVSFSTVNNKALVHIKTPRTEVLWWTDGSLKKS